MIKKLICFIFGHKKSRTDVVEDKLMHTSYYPLYTCTRCGKDL